MGATSKTYSGRLYFVLVACHYYAINKVIQRFTTNKAFGSFSIAEHLRGPLEDKATVDRYAIELVTLPPDFSQVATENPQK
jgi:hypothetical protein